MDFAIRTESSVPEAGSNAEVVGPHPLRVVEMMDGLELPEAALRMRMLQLVCVGGERGVEQGARRKPDARLERMQKARRDERPRAARVAEKLAQKAVACRIAVVLNVLFTLQPKMHHAVSPILGEGTDDESEKRCAEPEGHFGSVTSQQRSCQYKMACSRI